MEDIDEVSIKLFKIVAVIGILFLFIYLIFLFIPEKKQEESIEKSGGFGDTLNKNEGIYISPEELQQELQQQADEDYYKQQNERPKPYPWE